MPRIPRIQADKVIRSPKMSPGIAAAPYSALARAGAQIEQTGQYGMRVFDVIDEAERRVKASELESQMRSDLEDAAESFRMRTDFENFDKEADEFIKSIRTNYNEAIGDDHKLQEAVDRAYEWRSSEFMRTIQAKKAQVITNRGRGQLEKMVNQAMEDYAAEQTDEGKIRIGEKIAATAKAFAESSIISFKEAESIIQSFEGNAESLKLEYNRQTIWDEALNRMRTLGFDEAVKFINDSDLPSSDKNSMGAALKREETERAAQEKENEEQITEKWQDEALVKLHDGKLTFEEIMLSPLDAKAKEHWIGLLDAKNKAKLKEEKDKIAESDPEFYMTMLKQAYAGEIGMNVPISYIGKGLGSKDAEHIRSVIKSLKSEADKHETELMNLAIDSGSKMIIKGNLFTGFDAGEIRDAYLFEHALRAELEQEKERGKRLNMLTPGTSEYIVDKVLAPYLKDPITRLRETADKIRGKQEPEKAEGGVVKRKKGETIDEYLKRIGQR